MARTLSTPAANRSRPFLPALFLVGTMALLPGCGGSPDKKDGKDAAAPGDGNAAKDKGAVAADSKPSDKPAPPRVNADKPPRKVAHKTRDKLVILEKLPPVTTDNKNTLIKQHREQLRLTASSTWSGWPPANAIDDDIKSSWFSGKNDSAARGKRPWLQVNFPTAVAVRRVTILGNRDPEWLVGFTILAGRVTLTDKDGKVLKEVENEGTGNYRDFDFRFAPAVEGVRGVRFTSLGDQGGETEFGDIAIAEMQVD